MDPRLLRCYNRELQFVRELGAEFARDFPKIAGRLGLEGLECADPYVERLIESFAFLAARVQLKLEAQFPRFTEHLLEMVYPGYLAPTPSMAVVELKPSLTDATQLEAGFRVPRGSALRGQLGRDEQTPCQYRTAHEVTLWPLELSRVEYTDFVGDLGELRLAGKPAKAAIRLRLTASGGLKLQQLGIERLPLYLHGDGELSGRLYELLTGHVVGLLARPARQPAAWRELSLDEPVRAVGFEEDEALLPAARTFQGPRLIQECFALPQRQLFVELRGLGPAVRRCAESELEVILLLDGGDPRLAGAVTASNLRPFCTPTVNLFPRSADRIHLTESAAEYHVVPDRTRPTDFEVYRVESVVGHGTDSQQRRTFLPFYAPASSGADSEQAYYTVHRELRTLSAGQRARGPRSSYVGGEVFLSLVDGEEGPFRPDLKQLAVEVLCTNRDLPLRLPVGQGRTDFTLESGAPVESIRALAGPTPPRPSYAFGDTTWRLIGQLSLNYLSLTDEGRGEGAAALREMLELYCDPSDAALRRQIEGLTKVTSRPVTRRLPVPGPLAFGRGLEVTLVCDEAAFEGSGVVRFGALLERFFARAVSINSFTETVLRTPQRGEIRRWPARVGCRQLL